MNYFEFYPGDYLRDTTSLNLTEHGAYLRLLIAYYSKEKPLPAEHKELYQISCAISAADKAATRKVADEFFPVAVDGFRHKNRVDEEIAKAQKRIKTAQENGAKGGRKSNRLGNPPGKPTGSPAGASVGNPTGTQRGTRSGEALHTPHVIHQTPEDQEPKSRSEPDMLERFNGERERDGTPPLTPADVCVALRTLDVAKLVPGYAPLYGAIREGAKLERFVKAAKAVRADQRNLAYIVGKVRGELADERAAADAQQHLEQKNRAVGEQWATQGHDESEEDEDRATF
ncbi:DUF1376 domain-containing protein [Dyella sp. M7H15-1]|uniref:YdaU family protein n=1 Tax=Dyella sp. M7H15-1 TaxID=2501295 RepID=UPI00100501BA|nr:DUF1376 domain-containing protein [Dyella sp. M7H15-1]QAU22569.1 DUF1376 domain-containing protein [Dyella sp. M7H15-1]